MNGIRGHVKLGLSNIEMQSGRIKQSSKIKTTLFAALAKYTLQLESKCYRLKEQISAILHTM